MFQSNRLFSTFLLIYRYGNTALTLTNSLNKCIETSTYRNGNVMRIVARVQFPSEPHHRVCGILIAQQKFVVLRRIHKRFGITVFVEMPILQIKKESN